LSDILDEYRHIVLGAHEFSRIVFYKSDLQPSGPVYSILKAVEF
jgi:2'-5' RNA ligase